MSETAINGVFQAITALAEAAQDAERRTRDVARLTDPPPPYSSGVSNDYSARATAASEDVKRRIELLSYEYRDDHLASTPYYQFQNHVKEEYEWVVNNLPYERKGPDDKDDWSVWDCVGRVKERWVAQGIWDSDWQGSTPEYSWKHEFPYDNWAEEWDFEDSDDEEDEEEGDGEDGIEDGSEDGGEDGGEDDGESDEDEPNPVEGYPTPSTLDEEIDAADASLAAGFRIDLNALPTSPADIPNLNRADERAIIAYMRVINAAHHQSSRPHIQFSSQVAYERQRILSELRAPDMDVDMSDPFGPPICLNTRAYARVRDSWIKWGVWNFSWGIMPGMSWKHEHPIYELFSDDPMLSELREREKTTQYEMLRAETNECAKSILSMTEMLNAPSPLPQGDDEQDQAARTEWDASLSAGLTTLQDLLNQVDTLNAATAALPTSSPATGGVKRKAEDPEPEGPCGLCKRRFTGEE